MLSNSSVSKGKVASSPVFSSRYSLLIEINDFDYLLQKTEEYESHDKMPQFFNYGFTAKLKAMNGQANDGMYNIKKMLVSFNNDAELKSSEASHKNKKLKNKIEELEQKMHKMQKAMFLYSMEEFEELDNEISELEGQRLQQLKIIDECKFLDEITEKIYQKLSYCIFKRIEDEDEEVTEIKPNLTQETEKLFDYIFEYGKQLDIIENSEMENFETTYKDDDSETSSDSDDSEDEEPTEDYQEKFEEAQEKIESLKNELEEQKKKTEKFVLLFHNTMTEQVKTETELSHLKIEMLSLLRKSK